MINPEKLNFKHLIMTIGNLPSSYVESLSYYECLLWLCNYLENTVIPAVNNNAEALEELQRLFVELQKYVDNYFENLDVQEEINNKLDEMAQDGSLADIFTIIVENNIMPYINAQNENITAIENEVANQNINISSINNKVNSVASGKPAGSYATVSDLETDDPDHDNIYVVTADNKWYYYDTTDSKWKAGGTYLTADINLVEVAPADISMIKPVETNKSLYITYGKIYGRDGTQSSNSNWSCTCLFNVKPNDVIVIETGMQDYLQTWDQDKSFIGYKNVASSTNNITYNVESGVSYVSFNIFKDNYAKTITINGINIFSLYSIKWLTNEDNSIYPEKIYKLTDKIVNKSKYLANGKYWNSQGELTTGSQWNYSIYKIPVKLNDIVEMTHGRGLTMVFFDEDNNVVQAMEHTSSSAFNYTYTVTGTLATSTYLRFNVLNEDLSEYDLKINGKSIFQTYNLEWLEVEENNLSSGVKDIISSKSINKWYGKSSVMYGDSIVSGSPNTTPYAPRLKDLLSLENSNNEGVSGRPIADGTPNGAGTVTTVYNTISTYSSYDLVIIAGGTNDFKLNVPLGSILPVGSNNFNRNEFTGAYQYMLENIINTSNTIRIVVMTPLQRNNSGYDIYHTNTAGCKLIDYVNRIKEIASLYSVPVIDMYSNSSMNLVNLSTYTLDGLHPNNTGYEILSKYIAEQLTIL